LSEFISNVLKLVSGSVIAQILAIILIPIITRLYTPEDYGTFSLILAITAIIAIFSSLSYQLAIMLPKEDEDAAQIVTLCFILIIFSSIITGVFFSTFASSIAGALNVPAMEQYLWCVPFLVFFTASYSVLAYWNSRRKLFGAYAVAQVTNSLTSKGVQIGMGMMSASPFNLILGIFFGYFCAICIMLKGFSKDLTFFKKTSFNKVKQLAIRYKKFPIYTSWSTTSNTISTQITPILLAYFYSPLIVGYYSMALMVVQMPMSFIGSATGQVFFQKASEEKNRTGSVKTIVEEVHKRLISIGIFPFFVLMIMGRDLFAFFLGSQWGSAGEYASILSPWLFLVFIASPLSTLFCVLERQNIDLSFNFLILLSRIIVLYLGGIFGSPTTALIFFSLTGVVFWGWMNFYILKISGVSISKGIEDFSTFFLISCIVAIPLIISKYLSLSISMLFIIVGIVTSVYYTVIIFRDPVLKQELAGILKRVRP